jgi:hypothetical protein
MPGTSRQDPKGPRGTLTLQEHRAQYGPPSSVRPWWLVSGSAPQNAPANGTPANPSAKRRLARWNAESASWVVPTP